MLESKQERIAALERQVEDLMQDRKFLRTQIENLTSSRSMQAFTPPTGEGPRLCSLYRRRRTTAGREPPVSSTTSTATSKSSRPERGLPPPGDRPQHHRQHGLHRRAAPGRRGRWGGFARARIRRSATPSTAPRSSTVMLTCPSQGKGPWGCTPVCSSWGALQRAY